MRIRSYMAASLFAFIGPLGVLSACSNNSPGSPPDATFLNNAVSEQVTRLDLAELQRLGVTQFTVECRDKTITTPDTKPTATSKRYVVVGYRFAYGVRVIRTEQECIKRNHDLVFMYHRLTGLYSSSQYVVRTSEAYDYQTVRSYIQMMYDDIKKNATL